MADLITQADLEGRIGVRAVAELSNDQGGATADATVTANVCGEATDVAKGILWEGFPSDAQIEALVAADKAVKGAVVDIGCGILGMRRTVLQDGDGRGPYVGWRERAEKRLKETASGTRRARGEAAAGRNQQLGVTTNNTREPGRKTVFAATADNPKGPGGF